MNRLIAFTALALLAALAPLYATTSLPVDIPITITGAGSPAAYLSATNALTATLNSGVNTTIPNGGSATLTWDSANAASCTGTGFSTGGASGIGTATVSPTSGVNTYSVNCGGAVASATVTASGTLRDAAAGVGTGGCTGSGTSASPWNYLCIQNAVNAAVNGDTVFLRGGNWALNTTSDAAHVSIYNKAINLVGAGSGNTFDAWGHINNLKPSPDPCPTSGTSITCVYQTGTSYAFGLCPGFPWGCPGYIHIGPTNNASADPNCHDVTVSHIFFDGSQATAGGNINGLLSFVGCAGPTTVRDIRLLATTNNGGLGVETQFGSNETQNQTIMDSEFSDPLLSGVYAGGQALQLTGGNGVGSNYLIKNSVIYEGAFNPIYLSGVTYVGNQNYDFFDGSGNAPIDPAAGYAGSGVGGPAANYCPQAGSSTTGQCNGDTNNALTNNLWYGPGNTFAIGSTINDPSTSGGLISLNVTGNWIIAGTPDIDSCTWHLFNDQGNCGPGSDIGMTINVAFDTSCNESNNGTSFAVTNNSLKGTAAAYLNAAGSISTSGTAPSDWTDCKLGNPWTGTYAKVPVRIYGYNAQKNWLSSPSNQYVTNANTISPTQMNNFCAGGVGTVTGCATIGFNLAPTVSFTLGQLHGTTIDFASTSFTAQYGAVQWLASTSSTTPLSSDSRWSSNNGSFPNSAPNSYIPPVSLSGVAHGNTVYMWTMDSANNISMPWSAAVP